MPHLHDKAAFAGSSESHEPFMHPYLGALDLPYMLPYHLGGQAELGTLHYPLPSRVLSVPGVLELSWVK